MEPVVEIQEPKKSKRALWIVLGVVIVVLIGAGAAYYFVTNSAKQEVATTDNSSAETQEVTVASKSEVTQNLSTLGETLKQASADQAAAKAALKDANTPVKVAN